MVYYPPTLAEWLCQLGQDEKSIAIGIRAGVAARGTNVILPGPVYLELDPEEKAACRESRRCCALDALYCARQNLYLTLKIPDLLRLNADHPFYGERADRMTVEYTAELWCNVAVGKVLLDVWRHDITRARNFCPFDCGPVMCLQQMYASAAHAVQDLAEMFLVELWQDSKKVGAPPVPEIGECPWYLPFHVDWWYAALPALRRLDWSTWDRWPEKDKRRWEIGIEQEIAAMQDAAPTLSPTPHAMSELQAAQQQPATATGAGSRPCSHSPDFTSVDWFGVRYDFAAGLQAQVVRLLWEAWEQGGHSLSEQTIGDGAGSGNNRFRLYHVFAPCDKKTGKRKPHRAWETMIRSAGKGKFRLAPPDDAGITR